MKLIIDIPEMYYEFCIECLINRTDTVDQQFIANGIPYEERTQGEWIPVSERLPEYGTYLVTDEYGDVFEYDYDKLTVRDGKWSYCRRKIVAWMPLPEPYKEADNEC